MRQRRDEVDDGKTADRTQEQGAAPHALRQCGERNGGDQRPHRIGGDELPRQLSDTFKSPAIEESTPAGMISVNSVMKAAIANASRLPSGNRSLLPAGADIVV